MPFNGSGTFTLAEAAFVPNTVISSTVMNSDLSDIATNGLTNAVTKDGQTTITGAFKGFSGSVGLPMYSFSADTDSGMYRIGANNIGLSVNATKILDIATTGLTVTGTLSSTGTFSPVGVILAGDGTVSLPAYSFTTDPDSGVYRIGANNIGVAVNAAKVLDISTSGLNVIGTVSSNGAAFSPTAQAAGMVNGTIVVTKDSPTSNAMTIAIKTLAGTDPSATDIVYFVFRNVTPATGNYVVLQVTAALSLTITSGSTLGVPVAANTQFKLWVEAFNDAGTVRLAVINNVSGTDIYPLGQFPIASAVSEGGAGGADSAQVFYANATVTAKAYTILGYISFEVGLATVGTWTWSTAPRVQLHGICVPLPGAVMPLSRTQTGASATGTTVIPHDNTIPQNTEGDQYQSKAATPTSAAHFLKIRHEGVYASNANAQFITTALFQDATASALAATVTGQATNGNEVKNIIDYVMLAATTSATTFKIRTGGSLVGTTTFNGAAGSGIFNGVMNSYLAIDEIVT